MKEFVSCFVGLRVTGEDLNFDLITDRLGLKPTKCSRKGEPVSPRSREKAITDVWSYRVGMEDDQPLSEMIMELEAKLGDKVSSLQRLPASYDVRIWCSYHTSLAQGGFDLSPSNLGFLGRAGVPCTVSILSWGGVVDDEESENDSHPSN
ncbi:MAG: DUF4279 domain-containing protein [Bacillota bacterium]